MQESGLTKRIAFAGMGLSMLGALGMTIFYKGAFSPCIVPLVSGATGFDEGFPIGETITGDIIEMDILGVAKGAIWFWLCGLIWISGAILNRFVLGWGKLALPSGRHRLFGLAGAVFQLLGAMIFLMAAIGMVKTIKSLGAEFATEDLTMQYGVTLRSTLTGLATFTMGNIMSLLFLRHAMTGDEGTVEPKRKRRIPATLSFVPGAIAVTAVTGILWMIFRGNLDNGLLLAGSMVGFALPMMVGSIPMLVLSAAIPVEGRHVSAA